MCVCVSLWMFFASSGDKRGQQRILSGALTFSPFFRMKEECGEKRPKLILGESVFIIPIWSCINPFSSHSYSCSVFWHMGSSFSFVSLPTYRLSAFPPPIAVFLRWPMDTDWFLTSMTRWNDTFGRSQVSWDERIFWLASSASFLSWLTPGTSSNNSFLLFLFSPSIPLCNCWLPPFQCFVVSCPRRVSSSLFFLISSVIPFLLFFFSYVFVLVTRWLAESARRGPSSGESWFFCLRPFPWLSPGNK